MASAISVSISAVDSLKRALLDHFPSVKSSHLSEALATGLGFNTNAARLESAKGAVPNTLLTLDPTPFLRRLADFGYQVDPAFSFAALGVDVLGGTVPMLFRADMARLLEVLDSHAGAAERAVLRRRLATSFGEAFGLGHVDAREVDKMMVKQMKIGVDYQASQTGWGNKVNRRHPLVNFPGTDHPVFYYEKLPLASGKYIEYCTAMVSMPYLDSSGEVPQLAEAQELAARIGWKCEVQKEWSWHMAGATSLVLFRRTTPHHEMLRIWETSFKRWLYENKGRMTKGNAYIRRYVVEDILDCSSFPLDATDYEDCRDRYLKEFAPHLFHGMDESMAGNFKRLFEKWQVERANT
jgi:hypothetical protein